MATFITLFITSKYKKEVKMDNKNIILLSNEFKPLIVKDMKDLKRLKTDSEDESEADFNERGETPNQNQVKFKEGPLKCSTILSKLLSACVIYFQPVSQATVHWVIIICPLRTCHTQ